MRSLDPVSDRQRAIWYVLRRRWRFLFDSCEYDDLVQDVALCDLELSQVREFRPFLNAVSVWFYHRAKEVYGFIQVKERGDQGQVAKDRYKTWVFGTVNSLGFEDGETVRPELIVDFEPGFDALECQRLHAAISKLSVRQQEVLVLRYFHGLKFSEVAERLGLSMSYVVRYDTEARLKLFGILEHDDVFKLQARPGRQRIHYRKHNASARYYRERRAKLKRQSEFETRKESD